MPQFPPGGSAKLPGVLGFDSPADRVASRARLTAWRPASSRLCSADKTRPRRGRSRVPPLTLRTPSDFVEIDKKNGTLFAENADQLGERATLLRLFLLENQAHFYNEGKRHALTRQLAVYTIKNPEGTPFDKESASLLGRVLEEGFLSFDKVSPPTLRDSLALEDTLLQAARNGRNVLLDSRITENLHLFQYQLAYSLMPGHDSTIADDRMVTSLTTIMLLVRGHIVFICASSINTQAPLYDDAAWTRDAAQKYMETLLADNKKN